jgi:Fe-S cluster assembly protein SufB
VKSPLNTATEDIRAFARSEYKYGFVTDLETDAVPRGLSEDVIRLISTKKNEPEWLLEWRLKAYRRWLTMPEPSWANVTHPPIDYQDIIYYSAPKPKGPGLKSLDEVDPEVRAMFNKLGISLAEQERLSGVAMDIIVDSVSVGTTFKDKLAAVGVIFCSFSEAVQNHPELVRKYLGSVVPYNDNKHATLNSAVFTDGSFCYIPQGLCCPMELSTYFRINAADTGQFERTLIIADKGSYVSYLEGCTAPIRDKNQLHAAVVELVALDDAQIKYSTVQNWYPGNADGHGGIYNFVTKRGKCSGINSKISWTQVETGSAITWKYPSVILQGDNSVGEFYSVALTANRQQADTGTKMIHIGKNTRSSILSKGISAGYGQNTYRGMVKILPGATGARNHTQCDSLLLGDQCGAHTFPYIEVKNPSARVEHEASTSKIGEDQLFYCRQRGIRAEDAVSMIVNGFCREVFKELPMEFAVEAQKLLSVNLEGCVGCNWRKRNKNVLEIKNLHAQVEGREILRGINLRVNAGEVHAIMGPNGSGKSTLAQVLAGRETYKVTAGEVSYDGRDLLVLMPEERAVAGIFVSFQYPVEIPGVGNLYFLRTALNAVRKNRGLEELDAIDFLTIAKESMKLVEMDQSFIGRSVNEGFSGGEKKRNEIFQMAILEPKLAILDETDSGLDIDALRTVAAGVNALRASDRAMLVITHYQRLLDYIVPDYVHVMSNGRLVASGGKELALELEKNGYAGFEPQASVPTLTAAGERT